jgi:hypothetical protein
LRPPPIVIDTFRITDSSGHRYSTNTGIDFSTKEETNAFVTRTASGMAQG